jgi:predicted MPP superfamily phosphohydrolase
VKKIIVLIIFLLGILLFGYYIVVFEPNNLQIERQIITIENLPKTFDGARVVHLTDFHSYWFGSREKRVLEILKELNPCFLFITGDFIDPITKLMTDKELKSVKVFWQKLAEQHQDDRVFAVLGNHDTKRVGKYLEEKGIRVLDNENQKIVLNNQYIYLVGVDDPWTGRDNLIKAMEGVDKDKPKILLAHSPDIINQASKLKVDLVLAGHTHGGQVNIPFVEPFWIPSKYDGKYASGLFKIDQTWLYVNRGVGTSILPIRFNCPPEIALIKLTPDVQPN